MNEDKGHNQNDCYGQGDVVNRSGDFREAAAEKSRCGDSANAGRKLPPSHLPHPILPPFQEIARAGPLARGSRPAAAVFSPICSHVGAAHQGKSRRRRGQDKNLQPRQHCHRGVVA